MNDQDRKLLERAVELSRWTMETNRGGPFGAVVANARGEIVGEGWNEVTTSFDPTAHGEVVAIRAATSALGTHDLTGHVIYSSCEPCPMCLGAIIWARLDRLVFANDRKDAARIDFDDDVIYREVERAPRERVMVRCEHVPLDSARAVFEDWTRKTDKVPY